MRICPSGLLNSVRGGFLHIKGQEIRLSLPPSPSRSSIRCATILWTLTKAPKKPRTQSTSPRGGLSTTQKHRGHPLLPETLFKGQFAARMGYMSFLVPHPKCWGEGYWREETVIMVNSSLISRHCPSHGLLTQDGTEKFQKS